MKDQVTVYRPDTDRAGSSSALGSRFGRLDVAVRADAYRSLSQVAFVYVAVYTVAYFYYWFVNFEPDGALFPPMKYTVVAGVSVAFALWVGFGARAERWGAGGFTRMAAVMLVAGCFGIAGNHWGWETDCIRRLPAGLQDPLLARQLFRPDGVPWIGVWILMFANIVTLPARRVVLAGLVGSLMEPGIMIASTFMHGVPGDVMGPWAFASGPAFLVTFPTLMCVAIAAYASKRVFGMAEDVSEARRMGAYRLTERLGQGGMGEVWKAEHNLLARPAAVKLIRSEVLKDGHGSAARALLTRFEREAQATAALTSPHTVQVYDFGVTDGAFYYVMELLEGMDLRTLVEKNGPVPAARTVHFLRQACDSLADAHDAGLIHRDIKPANLFTCRRGTACDFLKVLDFGLVKESGTPDDDRTQLTLQGMVAGTPAFMAPEMAAGEVEVDGRADLYALGCVAYWLVTGALVFEASTPMAMLVQHAKEEPMPPAARSELDVPESVNRLILDCLAKRPEGRPGSAAEMAARLEEIECEIGAWDQERARAWWKLHLPALAAAPALAVSPLPRR